MTTTLAVDQTTGGPAWPLAFATGIQSAVSRLMIRLRSELGEVPSDVTIGLPLARWQTPPRPSPAEVVALVRIQAEAVDGVTVTSCTATVGQTIAVDLAFTYTDPDGVASSVTATMPLYAAEGLPAWYARPCGC